MKLEEFKEALSGIGIKYNQAATKDYIHYGYTNFYSNSMLILCEYNQIEECAKVIHRKFSKFIRDGQIAFDVEDLDEMESMTEYMNINNFKEALLNEFRVVNSVNNEWIKSRRDGTL